MSDTVSVVKANAVAEQTFLARADDGLLLMTEELPIRLAHRVKDLDELPLGLSDMPSIKKVKNWYAQSFEVSGQCARMAAFTNVARRNSSTSLNPNSLPIYGKPLRKHRKTRNPFRKLCQILAYLRTCKSSIEKSRLRSDQLQTAGTMRIRN